MARERYAEGDHRQQLAQRREIDGGEEIGEGLGRTLARFSIADLGVVIVGEAEEQP